MSMRPTLALGLLAAALAGVLGLELRHGASGAARLPPLPARPATTQVLPGTSVPPGAVATILDRPLFERTRRPPATAAVPAAAATTPRLAGVMLSGGQRSAIFAVEGGKAVVVAQGGRVGGLLVQSIAPDAVTVQGPAGSQVLRLAFQDPGVAPPADAGPPPVPALPGGVPAPLRPATLTGNGLFGLPAVRFSPTGMPLQDASGPPRP